MSGRQRVGRLQLCHHSDITYSLFSRRKGCLRVKSSEILSVICPFLRELCQQPSSLFTLFFGYSAGNLLFRSEPSLLQWLTDLDGGSKSIDTLGIGTGTKPVFKSWTWSLNEKLCIKILLLSVHIIVENWIVSTVNNSLIYLNFKIIYLLYFKC